MAFDNFENRISEVKSILVDLLSGVYGQCYREHIKEKLDGVSFVYRTSPDFESFVVKRCPGYFTKEERDDVRLKYGEYNRVDFKTRLSLYDSMIQYIKINFKELNLSDEAIDKMLYLFMGKGIDESYVDAFSSRSIGVLLDESVCDSVKETILKDQDWFVMEMEEYGLTKRNMYALTKKIDALIKYREMLKEGYQLELLENTECGKNIITAIENNIGEKVDHRVLGDFLFKTDLCALSWGRKENGKIKTGCVIKVPLVYMRSMTKDFADETLIHELIHAVESNGSVGLVDDKGNNVTINELWTQMLAKQVSNKLHQMGVYIFNDSQDKSIDEEICNYEYMFPLVEDFFSKYKDIISKCAIENKGNELKKYFGKSWCSFSKRLDEMFFIMNREWKVYRGESIKEDKLCAKLLKEMDEYYKNKHRKQI